MKGKGLLAALVVSLALNLFLVGLGAGALMFGHKGQFGGPQPGVAAGPAGQPGQARRGALWQAGRSLSEAHRPAYREMLRKTLQANRADLLEARRLKRQAFEAMGAASYDAAAVDADLGKARDLEFKARGRIENDMLAFAAALPPSERAAFSESLVTAMARGPGARVDGGRPGGPAQD